jgi:GT2 family glycosyltransferase
MSNVPHHSDRPIRGTAIVVTYNSGVWAERCLEALLAQPGWEVLVIDNASDDDTVRRASRFASQARIYQNTVNTGFAGGVNQGVRLAKSDLLVLINPDAVAAPGALDKLADALAKFNADAGGGMLLVENGKPQIGNMVRRLPTLGSALAELFLLNNIWRRNPWNRSYRCLDLDYARAQEVENPAGATLMFRRSTWDKVGGFDEGFFPVWFEDADFCANVLKSESKIVFEPAAVFDHGGAHSVRQISFYNHQLIWYRNMLRYFGKHYGKLQLFILRVAIGVGLTLRAVLCLITKPPKVSRKQGVIDYLRLAWNCGIRNPQTPEQSPRSLTAPPPDLVAEPVPTKNLS